MTEHNVVDDLRGASRLVIDATANMAGLVEAMHATIAGLGGRLPGARRDRTRGITGLVYRCVGGVTVAVGGALELVLAPLAATTGQRPSVPGREATLGVLNGVLGDHLEATDNPLAIRMRLRHAGRPLELARAALHRALPDAGGRILLQVHGLCMNHLVWSRGGEDLCAATARRHGYTPLQLQYNSGRAIADNGRALAGLLEALVAEWPVPVRSLVLVGHSMGGLVARSAQHHAAGAGHAWTSSLAKMIFLGSPHHGAPLERAGNRLDLLLGLSPYTLPFTRLGRVRSAGITDLRHGSLVAEDWSGVDRYVHAHPPRRTPVPLPAGAACYTIAALRAAVDDGRTARLVGDGLVPLDSALGRHEDPRLVLDFPPEAQWVARGMGHLELLNRPEVYARVDRWLADSFS